MNIEDFIRLFASQFEETEMSAFQPGTKFRELEEWSSLTALLIMTAVDEQYHVKLKANDIRASETINDLFLVVSSQMN